MTYGLTCSLALLLLIGSLSRLDTPDDGGKPADVTFSAKDYGIEVQVPGGWRLVTKANEAIAFGFSVPNESREYEAGVKCEIAPAPESLDEYRSRIDRRAERQTIPGVKLKKNEVLQVSAGEQLETEWIYEPADRAPVHDLELRLIANDQLYTFTLRAPDPVFAQLRPLFQALIASAKFSPPDTGLELTADGYCVQKKFRFGLKLPAGWKPSFPLSSESLFWATSKPKGIWNDNLLVIASQAQPLDLDALAEALPPKLRDEDPNCTVKSCNRVTQGKTGDALETVVETQRGPFRITVLERRYTGHRYNYEIKFTVSSELFEKCAQDLRRSADSFVEFVRSEDAKGT
jgi:hypothetical protein